MKKFLKKVFLKIGWLALKKILKNSDLVKVNKLILILPDIYLFNVICPFILRKFLTL